MKDKLLLYSFVAVIIISVVHWAAILFYLYWSVWWFDNAAHFLGGLAVGLLFFWVFKQLYAFKQTTSFKNILFITIFMVFVTGLGWEVFESFFGLSDPSIGETYWQDNTYDIIADIAGAIVAGYLIFKKKLHV